MEKEWLIPWGNRIGRAFWRRWAFLSQKGLHYIKVSHRLNVYLFSNILNALCSLTSFVAGRLFSINVIIITKMYWLLHSAKHLICMILWSLITNLGGRYYFCPHVTNEMETLSKVGQLISRRARFEPRLSEWVSSFFTSSHIVSLNIYFWLEVILWNFSQTFFLLKVNICCYFSLL